MRGEPEIHLTNPFAERMLFTGMPQEGKTNAIMYFLSITRNPWILFNTLNLNKLNNIPRLNPKMQRVVSPKTKADRLPLFKQTCQEAYAQGNVILAIDEVQNFTTKYTIEPEHQDVVLEGGNRNVGHWATTQFVANVHNDIIRSSKHHFIYRLFMPQDVDWYGKFVPKRYVEMSQTLPQYWFIYYKLGGQPVIMKPIKNVSSIWQRLHKNE